MKVSFIITTRNRKDELLKTLTSCFKQDYEFYDVHVVDDHSEDDTYESVRKLFPQVIISRNKKNIGSIASRNILLNRADADIIIGLDDDSRPISKSDVTKIVSKFNEEPDLGLIQFQEQGPQFPDSLKPGRLEKGEWHIASFSSNRYALRKSVLKETGLFQDVFFHTYEEPDLAIRIWDVGYRCIIWNEIVVWHEYSNLNRDNRYIRYLQTRNEQLSLWLRCPWILIVPMIIIRLFNQIIYSKKNKMLRSSIKGILHSLVLLPKVLKHRDPVKIKTFTRCLKIANKKIKNKDMVWKL